jgi:hypothetical protein
MLRYSHFTKTFKVCTDASKEGIGAVLNQDEKNGDEKFIQFISRTLQPVEQNLRVRERGAHAVINACETFRPYLYGSKFIIYTDHHSLQCTI